ncbi:MAG: hypothetical protein F6K19_30470 [Cyanothece sp. SIO1E1]|nr:hypothetical protein [Cyanothece sp. SIO1E1]
MVEIGKTNNSLCFCTSAFGESYVAMAQLLAQDLHRFASGYPFVIYTDNPQAFKSNPNVLAIKHSCRGVLPYHERRFAIWQALSIAPSVMYLDADVRICAPVPESLNFQPGLTARSCGSLQKRLKAQFNKHPLSSQLQHKKNVIEKMAHRAGINLDFPELKFINEFLFVITAHEGRELEFLQLWGDLAIYADTLGLHKHPTYAMALAAVKSGFPIYGSKMDGLEFFDDRIEKVRIKKKQSDPTTKTEYLNQQRKIEQKDQTLFQRIMKLVTQKSSLFYNRARVQFTAAVFPSALIAYPAVSSNFVTPGD